MEIGIKKLFNTFSVSNKWKSYKNDKQYGDYAVTPTPRANQINKNYAVSNMNTFLKQYNESLDIISTTAKPLTFFYRYDFAVKRIIGVAYMQNHVRTTGDSAARLAEKLIDRKQELVKDMILRYGSVLESKLAKLKTDQSRKKNIDSFVSDLSLYQDEMSGENYKLLFQIANELKQKYVHE